MGLTRAAPARGRRSLGIAACVGLIAVGVTMFAGPVARGSSPPDAAARTVFDPYSVTFVSLSTGWALGTAPCAPAGHCLGLRETTDAGRSWFARPLPAALVAAADRRVGGVAADLTEDPGGGLSVRFANTRDGWIYGGLARRSSAPSGTQIESVLWSTHDGGLIWKQQPLHGLGGQDTIFDLEASRGTAYLMESTKTFGTLAVKSSPVSSDGWHVSNTAALGGPAGGGEQTGAFVLAGSSGWLVEGNDRGTTGSARLEHGRWVAWTPPCAAVGHSFSIPAASTPSDLVASCVMGGFAYPLSKSAPPGAKLDSIWLYFSRDGGKTFTAGPQIGAHVGFLGVLASPTPAAILAGGMSAAGGGELLASFDGGIRWSVVHSGDIAYLGFSSPTQGVAIVRAYQSATSTMIMSFDGGHHWAPVSFQAPSSSADAHPPSCPSRASDTAGMPPACQVSRLADRGCSQGSPVVNRAARAC